MRMSASEMTKTPSVADIPDPISPAGKVYDGMIENLLTAEFDRRKTLEGRGATLMAASGTMLTLIFGLTVIVTGKDPVFKSGCAVDLLLAALAAFVVSAVTAIFVQTYGFKYQTASRDFLREVVENNDNWARRADDAARMWAVRRVNTITSLREGNNAKACLVTASLWAQVVAIGLLSASVGVELSGRL